jgi:hypothetical protein
MATTPSSAAATPKAANAVGRLLLGLFAVLILTSCGGTGGGTEPVSEGDPPSGGPPAPPDPTSGPADGRFVGTVTMGGESFFADALLTGDGELRLYVGGPDTEGLGALNALLQLSKPGRSLQFVGEVTRSTTQISGTGQVIGQDCAPPEVVAFCAEVAEATIGLTVGVGELLGEIEVATPGGIEAWSVELGVWRNSSEMPARNLAGQYGELLAEFERDGDVVITIDDAGKLFFQGASSGCTGNGDVSPHLDGRLNVYDVTLTIASCNATHAHLNGAYTGLATTTASSYWDYDMLLRVWLSTGDAAAPAAITMLAEHL